MANTAIQDAIANLDPNRSLSNDALQHLYVQRTGSFRTRLIQLIAVQNAKVFVTGQSGVGKTTEMFRLSADLSKGGMLCVVVDPGMVFNLTQIGLVELWNAGTAAILQLAAQQNWKPSNELRSRVQAIGLVWQERTQGSSFTFHPEAGRSQSLGFVAQETSVALSEVERALNRPVAILFDGLEKLPLSIARDIFSTNGQAMSQWPTRAVFVVPPLLFYGPEWEEAERHVADSIFLSALPVVGPLQHEVMRARHFFSQMADRRVTSLSEDLNNDLLQNAITNGAGIPRQFIQILRDTYLEASLQGIDQPNQMCLDRALTKLRNAFRRKLRPTQAKRLLDLHNSLPATIESSDHELIAMSCLIQYEAGDRLWHDANPVLQPVLG